MKNLIFSSEEEGFTEDDTQQLKQVTPDTMISLNIQCILFVELIYVVVQFNPFAPEPPNRPCRSTSFLPFVTSSVLTVEDNFVR